MLDLGRHAVFIWASYAAVVAVLAALVAWLILDGRRLERLRRDLEAKGIRRRSESDPTDASS
ncbi:MAG: heme exporter protein CcmD [Hyphomicrobiaceae bacterium]